MIGQTLPLRPHHALCLQFFIGKGYGDGFVANMAAVKKHLDQTPNQKIILVDGTDSLCAFCPNRMDDLCETASKSNRYDRGCLAACGLHIGQVLPWRELSQKVRVSVALSVKARAAICSDCRWDSICRREQKKMIRSISF